MDYDSDYETKADGGTGVTDVDPYSGLNLLILGQFAELILHSRHIFFQRSEGRSDRSGRRI